MMVCKIVQNEGVICIFLLACIGVVSCAFVGENLNTIQGLCTSNRFIYTVKPGETQQFKLTSTSSRGDINKWYQKSKRKCRKEFKTNNGAAHFSIVISNMSVPTCSEKCNCNYFEIAEPGYNEKYCGVIKEDIYFESKSDYLSIDFHHEFSMLFEVTLTFTVKRNSYIITGLQREGGLQTGHFLETPYFPNEYQSDYISEYILQSDDERGHVMLMFLDFQIASESFIEVVGHNGTHPAVIYGNIFRPPVFVSGKHQLSLKFEANNQFGIGFRAICFFLKDSDFQARVPYTDCGSIQKGSGGSITLKSVGNHKYYDCLWHLSPPPVLFTSINTFFLSVSNISFENVGPNASLEFREGLNSKSKLVKSISWDSLNASDIPAEITVSASNGLYIRFNGLLNSHSFIRMIYFTYRNGNCSDNHLVCNGRCLPSDLRCDGIEHCFNGSDEEDCSTNTVVQTTYPTVIKRKLHHQNTVVAYYVVLSFGVCGLVGFILVVVFILYRIYKPGPRIEESTAQPQVISEMAGPLPGPHFSIYLDQPPSYDDFIRSSDSYPPPLYTRAAKRNSEPYPIYHHVAQHTTSFCGRETLKHRMVHSCELHSLSSHSDENCATAESELPPQPGCSFGTTNTEWIVKRNSLKRTTSLDSTLSKKIGACDCHFHLSITHSFCPHMSDLSHVAQIHSLPRNFKINCLKPNEIDITFHTSVPEVQCMKK